MLASSYITVTYEEQNWYSLGLARNSVRKRLKAGFCSYLIVNYAIP